MLYLSFILFIPFFLSLLPFLHIISPIYNLASERYLYLPTFFAIIGIGQLLFLTLSKKNTKLNSCILIVAIFVLCIFSTRAYLRTLDWKDSISLFSSALKEAKSDLIKGLRLQMLGGVLAAYSKDTQSQVKGNQLIDEGTKVLESSLLQPAKDKPPQVIKSYGLDLKTTQAKTAYLLAFAKLGKEGNIKGAYELLKPYMQDFTVIDTQILDLYLGVLFATNNLDEAERLLNYALIHKPSPTVFIALSEIYKNKYSDLHRAELTLKESFKYFPYDTRTLESLKDFYFQTNNLNEYAFFSYLHGIRAHLKQSPQ
jgi:tetratricopeptide (TPR) repeat protein